MNLLELAKQGNAKAIAELMNSHLQPKGITAKTDLNNGCLQVILESAQVPEQQAMVAFVYKGMSGLGVPSIHKVRICGRQTDLDFTVWVEEFRLTATESSTSPSFVPAFTSHPESSDQVNILNFFKKANPLERKILGVFGSLILVFLFGSCVGQVGGAGNYTSESSSSESYTSESSSSESYATTCEQAEDQMEIARDARDAISPEEAMTPEGKARWEVLRDRSVEARLTKERLCGG